MLKACLNRCSLINSVTMAPTATESNPRRLIETFPVTLLANIPNLQRWEINQADTQPAANRATLVFQQVVLTRLRYSSIEELHLYAVQLESYMELHRLVTSIVTLGNLRCTSVGFRQVATVGLNSLKVPHRRRHVKLSMLTVSSIAQLCIRVSCHMVARCS